VIERIGNSELGSSVSADHQTITHSMYHIELDMPEAKVEAMLRRIVWKKGRPHCPRCGAFRIRAVKDEARYHCPKCRRKFSLLSHTWMKDVKIPLPLFIALLSFWLEDATVELASKLAGLSRPTVYRYYRLFRRLTPYTRASEKPTSISPRPMTGASRPPTTSNPAGAG
jgi:transposase-like protein